jgi:hypothetical protein
LNLYNRIKPVLTVSSCDRFLAWIIHKRKGKKRKESLKRFRIKLSRTFSTSILP